MNATTTRTTTTTTIPTTLPAVQLSSAEQQPAAAAGAGEGAPAQRRLPFPLCYTMSFSTRTFMDDFDGSSCAVQ
ncbi:hypothetical protein DIPPA_00280 [Diplonema papillatum]|nr:hypothetical protein DIPPA_00283 [Diplonema papillatum]KAJ9456854.1 hypothetical protein DIPPA_00280 [Diplonema papillatum]